MQPLVAMIERYKPGFRDAIVPADPEMVSDLEELTGPLPGAYRRFLSTMGQSTDGFYPGGADFTVEDRLANYQLESSLSGSYYLLVGAGGPLEPGGDLYMDRSRPYGDDDCELALAPFGPTLDESTCVPFQAGLEEFLYIDAFRRFRLPLLGASSRLAPALEAEGDETVIDRLLTAAELVGFKRVGPVQRSALFERGDAAMVMNRNPRSSQFQLEVRAADRSLLGVIVDQLTTNVPLRRLA